MSKKRKIREANKEIFNTKEFFVKYAKRYGITLLIAVPIILFLSYFLYRNVEWYSDTLAFFVSLALLLLACLIYLIIFTKLDDKKEERQSKEDRRDPFAD